MHKLKMTTQIRLERMIGRKIESAYAHRKDGMATVYLDGEPHFKYYVDMKAGTWQEFAHTSSAANRLGTGKIPLRPPQKMEPPGIHDGENRYS
jgi:hypothetical protein